MNKWLEEITGCRIFFYDEDGNLSINSWDDE